MWELVSATLTLLKSLVEPVPAIADSVLVDRGNLPPVLLRISFLGVTARLSQTTLSWEECTIAFKCRGMVFSIVCFCFVGLSGI